MSSPPDSDPSSGDRLRFRIAETAIGSDPEAGREIFVDVPKETTADPDQPVSAVKEILRHMRGVLKPHGFRKSGQKFLRKGEFSTQWVDLQKSPYRAGDEPVSFTVNLAITIHELCDDPPPPRPRYSDRDFSVRIGQLSPDPRDIWWKLRTPADVKGVWRDLEPLLSGPGLELLDAARSLGGVQSIASRLQEQIPRSVLEFLAAK